MVLGEAGAVQGYALGGAVVLMAEEPEQVRDAWHHLPVGTGVVVLTARAAAALRDDLLPGARPLTTVIP